ncbi:MAG: tRNA (adenosine(37)-N6)-threonylcarbamoyltransferase complex ATPase subunit type 1 TsaE [Lacipirellulaceae bacterium]
MEIEFHSKSEADTDRLGQALADCLPAGTTIALIGTLGAGKTRLVQAVATALGVSEDEVNSPTFVLINEYEGQKPIYHFDAYRLADDDEFLELGPEEYFDSEGLTFVEWADKVERCLPAEHVRIEIEVVGENERQFGLSATTERLAKLLSRIHNL